MTSEERRAAENGIWLCAVCSRLIDDAEEAYPAVMLQGMKRWAETEAAKASRSNEDVVSRILAIIDQAHQSLISIIRAVRGDGFGYLPPYMLEDFRELSSQEKGERIDAWMAEEEQRSMAMKFSYHIDIEPIAYQINALSEPILGGDHAAIVAYKRAMRGLPVNVLAMERFVIALLDLRAALELR